MLEINLSDYSYLDLALTAIGTDNAILNIDADRELSENLPAQLTVNSGILVRITGQGSVELHNGDSLTVKGSVVGPAVQAFFFNGAADDAIAIKNTEAVLPLPIRKAISSSKND